MKRYTDSQLPEAAKDLLDHKILLLPTDTVYGAGVVYGELDDLHNLKHIKHRPETKPIPFMVASAKMIEQIAILDDRSRKIISTFLPGPLTLILKRKEIVPAEYTNGMDTIAVRIPDAPNLLEVIEMTGRPLLVSSANESGKPAALNIKEAIEALPHAYGILEGICSNQQASTILDCTKPELQILRPGPLRLEDIQTEL